jgi:type I restriction-modification system DNA methylase subunit
MAQYTKEELREIFRAPFNRESWKAILHNLFRADNIRLEAEQFTDPDEPEQGYYMGVHETADSYRIGLFYYKIDNGSVAHKKVGLRSLVKRFINPTWGDFDAAIVVFNDGKEWRLSFVCDIKDVATTPKRFTFVFGEPDNFYRTPISRFLALQSKEATFENIREAFSVDALSDDFFDSYRELYADFVQYITGKRYVKEGSKWVERELCSPNYQFETSFNGDEKEVRDYIKKMFGRIVFLYFLQRKGWLNEDRQYMHNLYYNSDKKDNFLDGVLETLFFEVLNTDKPYRTEAANELPGSENIPYLNGGLFAKDDVDDRTCVFPEEYFKRLFDFLDSYNFTIDENDAEDAEIGIDPEMLGRIFENLLEDNKDKGAFYTPKEIVTYMCKESIIAYLQNSNFKEEGNALIRQFVETLDSNLLSLEQRKYIKDKLKNVKICDPAIGSGAFPMGLVNLLSKLYAALRLSTEAAEIKRHIMENSIYGVDIEKGAVDIARLRFWLAMIVEENEPMPLPNLHFKIMHGNSLIESYRGLDLSDLTRVNAQKTFWDSSNSERESLVSDLKRYYGESDHTERQRIFDSIIKNVRRQIHAKDENLSQKGLDPSDNSQFFLWHTWFTDVFEKGGFDIVIGNPPYGANIDSLTELYESLYPETSHGYKDIYKYFFDQGMRITKPKGILCYITPNTYLRQPRYGDVRRFLLKFSINQILDLGEDIFEDAVVPVAITLTTKEQPGHKTSFVDLTKIINVDNAQEVLNDFKFISLEQAIWHTTINNIFVENVRERGKNEYTLDQILEMKDAGFKYQRTNVGLANKGKNDLAERIFYTGELESDEDTPILIGKDINEFFHSLTPKKVLRHNYLSLLKDNESTYFNKQIMTSPIKLIWRQTAPYFIGTILSCRMFFGNTIQAGIIKPEFINIVSYEYLCGLLNSTTLRELYEANVKESGRVFPQVKLEKLKPLPIIIPSDDIKEQVEQLVRCIIEYTARGLDVREQKEKLDKIVADIYKQD